MMLSRSLIAVVLGLLLIATATATTTKSRQGELVPIGRAHRVLPPVVVPDAATAVAIALAVLTPIYGKDDLADERPFVATLKGNEWTVKGTLPKGYVGGTAWIVISKSDGRILDVGHGR